MPSRRPARAWRERKVAGPLRRNDAPKGYAVHIDMADGDVLNKVHLR